MVIDEGDTFFLIKSGKVKVYANNEHGKEVVLNVDGPGQCFGELALMDTAPRSASVITLEPMVLAVVSRSHFERCLSEHPEFMFKMVRPLVQRIRELTRNMKNLALLDVYGRVSRTLLDLAMDRNDEQVIEQPLTHEEIANWVGASREMVGRILKDLERGGYIEKRDGRLAILRSLPHGWKRLPRNGSAQFDSIRSRRSQLARERCKGALRSAQGWA